MKGYTSRYLYYESNKQSIVTIPRSIIEALELNWKHKDEIYVTFRIIEGQDGLFLYKRDKTLEQQTYSYLDEYFNPIIPYGYVSRYLYYKSNNQSQITIPRPIIEASGLNWNHKDKIFILLKSIQDVINTQPEFKKNGDTNWLYYRGLFLFKKGY